MTASTWEELARQAAIQSRIIFWATAVEGGRARMTSVESGQRTGLTTQLLSGLATGAQVVCHPDDMRRDGARVKAR